MTNESIDEMPCDDEELADVEHLLKQMSLKKPKVAAQPSAPNQAQRHGRYQRELLVAAACLLIGFLCGRIANVSSDQNSRTSIVTRNLNGISKSPPQFSSNDSLTKKVASGVSPDSPSAVHLIDQGVFLINGQIPVRKYEAYLQKKIMFPDPRTGKPVEVAVPVREIVVASSPCT